MPNQYLLLCKCGKHIPVETTQAGQTVECSECQSQVEIPSYSQIKKLPLLEQAAEEKSTPRGKKNWGYGQGVLFAAGMALLIIFGILASVFFYLSDKTNVKTPTFQEKKEAFTQILDSMQPAEQFDFWEEEQKKHPPKEWKPASHLFTQTFSKTFFSLAIVCSVLTIVGLGCTVSALLVKQEVKRKKRKPRATR